jgi:hypothetical protein
VREHFDSVQVPTPLLKLQTLPTEPLQIKKRRSVAFGWEGLGGQSRERSTNQFLVSEVRSRFVQAPLSMYAPLIHDFNAQTPDEQVLQRAMESDRGPIDEEAEEKLPVTTRKRADIPNGSTASKQARMSMGTIERECRRKPHQLSASSLTLRHAFDE